MHAHRVLAALALTLLGTAAAQAAVEMTASPSFDAPRSARVAPPGAPRSEVAVLEIVSSEQRFAARSQAVHRAPQRPKVQLPDPPVGALVFATVGALVLLRGRRSERR